MSRTAALSLAALLLYPLAMLLPVIAIEQMGAMKTTTIWGGVVALLADGHVVIGLIVLICSVIAPVGKLAALFALCGGEAILNRRHRAATYRLVEFLGRWGMVDVLLVALLVAAVKLGDWVEVQPGPGVIAFASVVVLSLLASASFEPEAIWEDEP